MTRVLFAEERRRASPVYRMNSNRGIFFRLATSGSENVSARKRSWNTFDTVRRLFARYPKSGGKSGGKASGRIFRNEWRRLRWDGSIKIRAFPRLASSTSGRRCHVVGSLGFRPASRVNSISVGKIKRSASHLLRDTVSLHLHREIRVSERASLGESRISAIDRTRSASVVNARHALTPSGCICIQQRKQRSWPPLVHRYAPLGSFSLNADEGRRDGNRTFPSKRWRIKEETVFTQKSYGEQL